MEKYKLSIKPYSKDLFCVNLYENRPDFDIDRVDEFIDYKIFSDLTYSFYISNELEYNVLGFYINGYKVKSSYNKCTGEITFNNDDRIFSDYYGFVQISLEVENSETRTILYSDYLNIMVKDKDINKSIKLMSEYVFKNQSKLLFDNNMRSLNNYSLYNNSPKSLEAYDRIIANIIKEYSSQFKIFQTSAKYVLRSSYTVDKYEKLTYVDSKNINYIVQHPEQLREISPGKGIGVGNKNYIPNQTLINDNTISYDIFENRVLVGFIPSVIKSIDRILKEIITKLKKLNDLDSSEDGYEVSAGYIYSVTKIKLEEYSKKLSHYQEKLNQIYVNYKKILVVKDIEIDHLPKPTPIFMNIRHYNSIYRCVEQWFDFGIFDLQVENYLLPMLANSQLYEYYVLLKLYDYFIISGYNLTEKDRFKYNQGLDTYKETTHCNTFVFDKNNMRVSLYYQPVINKDAVEKNGIFLLRNNCIGYIDLPAKKYYFLPDFLVKIESEDKSIYIILDAKFSTTETVKRYRFDELVFKYLYSIYSFDPNGIVAGLCAISGKTTMQSLESVYNTHIPDSHLPFSEILSLVEAEEKDNWECQVQLLDQLFNKYIMLL